MIVRNTEIKPKTNKIIVIGLGMSSTDLTESHMTIIENADILVGGKRHLEFFDHLLIEKRVIDSSLDSLFEYIREQMQNKQIVVLASGDPLFFGIGERLTRVLGSKNLVFYSNISSVSAAFSKINMPWQDANVISLHGRGHLDDVLKSLQRYQKNAILTSPAHTPSQIARWLMKKYDEPLQFWVFERMGHSDAHFDQYELNEAAMKTFAEPNLVVCIKGADTQQKRFLPELQLYLGMPDNFYAHENSLITKAEVRVVSLSKLALQSDHVLWDLGAGSGSVGIEASLFIKTGRIVAVEKNARRIYQIKQNKHRFQVHQLEIVQSVLPDGISALPTPDRIFIGGGGNDLDKIIVQSATRLRSEGIMVLNTVLMDSFNTAYFTLKQLNFDVNITQIQVNESKIMTGGIRMAAQNPVWILIGKKRGGEDKE
jgi:precorrin-6Y C5,15-methyltransferase (decarboxylating)